MTVRFNTLPRAALGSGLALAGTAIFAHERFPTLAFQPVTSDPASPVTQLQARQLVSPTTGFGGSIKMRTAGTTSAV
jgi:hypothetical protein